MYLLNRSGVVRDDDVRVVSSEQASSRKGKPWLGKKGERERKTRFGCVVKRERRGPLHSWEREAISRQEQEWCASEQTNERRSTRSPFVGVSCGCGSACASAWLAGQVLSISSSIGEPSPGTRLHQEADADSYHGVK